MMVAATFPNLSFENPPGTGPTLLSTVQEPYSLGEGSSLTIEFAGATTNVVVLASDFEDITAVTAAELAAVIEERVEDLGASDDGGYLRLTSLLTGEDVTLRVQAGGVNDVLGFSLIAVTGETYQGGPPDGWAVIAEVYSSVESAEFADEAGRPEEIFDGNDEWPTVSVSQDLAHGLFDLATIPTQFETFRGWAPYGVLVAVPTAAAGFDAGTVEVFEDFEEEWGLPTYFTFLPAVHLQAGVVPDDFEADWGQGGAPSYAEALFAGGAANEETFESAVPQTHVVTVLDALVGEEYRVTINGVGVPYVAQPGDAAVDIASGLATAVTNSLVTASGSYVIFTPLFVIVPDSPDRELVVQVSGPRSTSIQVVLAADHPLLVEEWVGQDNNPDFD